MDKKMVKALLLDLLRDDEQLAAFIQDNNAELLSNLQERWQDFLDDKAVVNSGKTDDQNANSGGEYSADKAVENNAEAAAQNVNSGGENTAKEAVENSGETGDQNANSGEGNSANEAVKESSEAAEKSANSGEENSANEAVKENSGATAHNANSGAENITTEAVKESSEATTQNANSGGEHIAAGAVKNSGETADQNANSGGENSANEVLKESGEISDQTATSGGENSVTAFDDAFSQSNLSLEKTPVSLPPLVGDTARQNQANLSVQSSAQDTMTPPIPSHTPQPTTPQFSSQKAPLLPNAQQGKPYQAPLSPEVIDVRFAPECGLLWDSERREIIGTPTMSGEVKLLFQLLGLVSPLVGSLYINADPNSLWKDIPSDKAAKFYKADNHHERLPTEVADLLAARVRGRSHAHVGSFCDDDFALAYFAEQNVYLLTVSDGAGSAAFSREGSRLAVEAVKKAVGDLLAHPEKEYHRLSPKLAAEQNISDEKREEIAKSLVGLAAYQAFAAHHQALDESVGVSLKSLSCTLLIAVIVPLAAGKWLTVSYWVGDGAAAVFAPENNSLCLLGEADSGQYSGETLFLSAKEVGENLQSRIRSHISEALPLVILMTDGVSDPKFETEAQLHHAEKWQALWQELQAPLAAENAAAAMQEWLGFHSKGNYDDRSLALLVPKRFKVQAVKEEQTHG